MPLKPNEYENTWEKDPAIREIAEGCLREWLVKDENAESAWGLAALISSKQAPDKALCVILGIMALDEKNEVVEMLAAGPLEDFLTYSGIEYIDVIEKLATKNPRFKILLNGVWPSRIDWEVWKRIEIVRGDRPPNDPASDYLKRN